MSKTTTNKKTATTVFIHPYNGASAGAKTLTENLNAKRILTGGRSRFKHKEGRTVINWGSSEYHVSEDTPMLNPPASVATASNKLKFFEALLSSSVRMVPFTTDREEVQNWLDEGSIVCARTKLTGHSGEGLVILDPESEKELDISEAKLYTKYVKKALEYRVHVFRGEVIRIQKKILRPELTARIQDPEDSFSKDDINWQVRNHGSGFIYVTDGVAEDCPQDVKLQAIRAVRVTKLDFGAVDLIWNNRKQQSFVLEINTSPGLEGGTIEAYVEAFQKFITLGRPINDLKLSRLSGRWDKKTLAEIVIWEPEIGYEGVDPNPGALQRTARGEPSAGVVTGWCSWSLVPYLTNTSSCGWSNSHSSAPHPDIQLLAQDLCIFHGLEW